MSLFDWFRRKTILQLALQRGLEKGNIAYELRDIDPVVNSRQDAEAICEVLTAISRGDTPRDNGLISALCATASLFQKLESEECDACSVLHSRGIPLLLQEVEEALASKDEKRTDDVLFVLKILVMYGSREGVDILIRIARENFKSEDWVWNVILCAFGQDHPLANYVFTSLGSSLPDGFIAVSLLDGANRFCLEGGEMRHPFDSDEGVGRLHAWLIDSNEERFSYATSAVAALPFINHPKKSELLQTATRHPSPEVRLEGAWAAAKLDEEAGFSALASMCLDMNFSSRACDYLRELKRPDLIPTEATAPDFAAKAEFTQWLAHPNELGRPPDKLDVYDHRTLLWPPDFKERPVWLLRYVVHQKTGLDPDDVGIGMVGTTTWCLFSYDLNQRPPEDCYALHCFWEMERGQIELQDVEANNSEYDTMLSQWTGGPLDQTRIESVAELESKLRHPQKLVAVARGKQNGDVGWVVLDGPDSRWYSEEEFPADERGKMILKIHIGRRLLGLPMAAERKKWLQSPAVIPDEKIISAYERLLTGCLTAPEDEQRTLLTGYSSPLKNHFEDYVNAVTRVRSQRRAVVVANTYEAILVAATTSKIIPLEKALDTFTPVGQCLDEYTGALFELGRGADALALARKLLPLWEHNLGYGKLGAIAFKAGDYKLAEELLLKLKNNCEDWPRSEEMTHLAEIWHQRGETTESRELMLECFRHTLREAVDATGSDIEFHERIYLRQIQDFERIFGDTIKFAALGLPNSTLSSKSASS